MTNPAERLRAARIEAGFGAAKEAASAMGLAVSTYLAHENGSRGYPAKKAGFYAQNFHVPAQWLLFGTEDRPESPSNQITEIISIMSQLSPLKRAQALGYLHRLAEEANGA